MRFVEESWPALSCREASVRLSYQSLGPTADSTGEETVNSKLGLLWDADRYDSDSVGVQGRFRIVDFASISP